MASSAHINPDILRWMRERVGLGVNEAASALGIKSAQLQNWETGEAKPTFRQAQKLAQTFHAPFGYLFLAEPPLETLPLPDLRTVGAEPVTKPSIDLRDTVRQALQRQTWYLDHLQQQGSGDLPFIGRFSLATSTVQQVVDNMRAVLNTATLPVQPDKDGYLRHLVDAAEAAGILVMRSGIVGNNTHRPLDVGEFRGFAISHPQAPVIFINIADAPSARVFTLLHELAHLWLGCSGISNVQPGNTLREEVFCNAVAGEFLVPQQVFTPLWQSHAGPLPLRVAELARRFHVSTLVVMRRALDLGFIDKATYWQHYQAEVAAFRNKEGGQGNFYRNAHAKNSKLFARAVLSEALSGRLLLRDAGQLLGVQPNKLKTLAGALAK